MECAHLDVCMQICLQIYVATYRLTQSCQSKPVSNGISHTLMVSKPISQWAAHLCDILMRLSYPDLLK